MKLRGQIQRLARQGYTGRTGNHKLLVHVHTLHRLGLLDKPERGIQRYVADTSSRLSLARMLRLIPNVSTLERVISRGETIDVAAAILGLDPAERSQAGKQAPPIDEDEFAIALLGYYREIVNLGFSLCPVNALLELLQIRYVSSGRWCSAHQVSTSFRALRAAMPGDLRIHVDRRGLPAYLVVSDSVARRASGVTRGDS